MQELVQPFSPVFDARSKILILGSFPSVKSRENGFYYGNPQNRFWRLLAALFQEPIPSTVSEKRGLLLSHGIALWDVIERCRIEGSDDSSIRDAVPAAIGELLRQAPIERIYANGAKAYTLYVRHCERKGLPAAQKLPSTSPANAAWSLTRLMDAWQVITKE